MIYLVFLYKEQLHKKNRTWTSTPGPKKVDKQNTTVDRWYIFPKKKKLMMPV